jgi:hypothetical protein
MNFNISLICEACENQTNCRIGMSNRDEQPFRFCCRSCGAPIDIVLHTKKGGVISGATQVEAKGPFDDKTDFVDLHIDFPVTFEKYEMGMTPFLRAFKRIGDKAMGLHAFRLNYLNSELAKTRMFGVLLKHYARGKVVPLKLNIERSFDIKLDTDKPQDINAALYSLIAKMMFPFAFPGQDEDSVDAFQNVFFKLTAPKECVEAFVDELADTGLLKNLQLDCLEIYPKIWAAELPLRPALFLDFDAGYLKSPVPMRVSLDQFESYKDLFKDISEIIARQLVVVAGLNNLQKRQDHNAFLPVLSKAGKALHPASLDEFADVDFGRKLSFIDDSWFTFTDGTISNHLRNAIAHYKAEYDDVTQLVTYFPKKEGMKQQVSEEIYFIEFMRRLLLAYREMHRLHHSMKCLFYFRFIIQKKT